MVFLMIRLLDWIGGRFVGGTVLEGMIELVNE
jgi:hypothetical protein